MMKSKQTINFINIMNFFFKRNHMKLHFQATTDRSILFADTNIGFTAFSFEWFQLEDKKSKKKFFSQHSRRSQLKNDAINESVTVFQFRWVHRRWKPFDLTLAIKWSNLNQWCSSKRSNTHTIAKYIPFSLFSNSTESSSMETANAHGVCCLLSWFSSSVFYLVNV